MGLSARQRRLQHDRSLATVLIVATVLKHGAPRRVTKLVPEADALAACALMAKRGDVWSLYVGADATVWGPGPMSWTWRRP